MSYENEDKNISKLDHRKAKAFDEIKKHIDKEGDFYMSLYRETRDPTYSLLNSHYDALLGHIEELEDADDERWRV